MSAVAVSRVARWVLVFAVLAGIGGGGAVLIYSTSSAADAAAAAAAQDVAHAQGLSKAFRAAAKEVIPCVVTIQKTAVVERVRAPRRRSDDFRGTPFEDFFDDDFMRRFFEERGLDLPPREESGVGSGVIIDKSGVILTNHHVVAGGGKVTVRLHDGRTIEASDVKSDPRTDLAVVRIKVDESLPAARFGDSDALEIGDWVLAIGNPFGLAETVTAGIISAKGRGIGIADREDFLQTDAAINPGNSGGPLINLSGEIVGVNTAISSRNGGYQGVGFAIPANLARWVSKQLISKGAVQRAYLGAVIQPLTPDLAKEFGVPAGAGAVVTKVLPDSPAAEAGLKPMDVVVRFSGKKIASPRELVAAVEQVPVGATASAEIIRDGQTKTLSVKVREQPKDYGRLARRTDNDDRDPDAAEGSDDSYRVAELGFDVGELSEALAARLGLKGVKGVVISRVERGSAADLAGLEPGLVVSEVNRSPVASVEQFRKALEKRSPREGVLLLVQTASGSRFVVLQRGS
jgi:serine protease Do